MTRRAVLRLIDANANRALEGLRVCEDVVRFSLDAEAEFQRLRRLRHAIARAVGRLPISARDRLAARAIDRDAGRRAPSRRLRSLDQMFLINCQRAKEALRVLEECARLFGPRYAASFQRLRFQAYDLERDLVLTLGALRHP